MNASARPPRAASDAAADICVIVNAKSGKTRGAEKLRALETHLAAHPGRFAVRLARSGGSIEQDARRAAADGFAVVAAAGGDGTIRAVAAGLAGSGAALGVVPLGTFNYFARSLGLSGDLAEAVGVLVGGTRRPWTPGEVNGRVFLNNASLGLYPSILRKRESVYHRWGRSRLAAHGSVLMTLAGFRAPLALRVTVDGEVRRVRTPMVFIARNPRQLEAIGIEGAEGMGDSRFALYIAPDCSRWQLFRYALRLALRQMKPGRDFELIHGRDILVETARPQMTVAFDGERERLAAPFRFQLIEDALNVLVPATTEKTD